MYDDLLACDQLIQEQTSGAVFQGFREGKIQFSPTYKYDLFSEDYDTSEKCRAPAYTDRVLFTRRRPGGELPAGWTEGEVVWYNRAELRQSDHRPVLAVFDVEVRRLRPVERERTVGEVVRAGPSHGRLVLSPLTSPGSSSWPEVQESLAAALSQLEVSLCLSSQLRGGEVMLQLSSVLQANKLIGRQLQTSLGSWTVSASEEAVMEEEMRMFSEVNTAKAAVKKPPPRPSAPPAAAAASVRPTRRAPAPPGVKREEREEREETLSEEEEGEEEASWSPALAPLDWPQEVPTWKLASLDWPDEEPPESRESSQPPAQPPPPPPCPDLELDQPPDFAPPSLDQSNAGPPPFSPPVLSQSSARGPPPPVPSRGPPPPVPRR